MKEIKVLISWNKCSRSAASGSTNNDNSIWESLQLISKNSITGSTQLHRRKMAKKRKKMKRKTKRKRKEIRKVVKEKVKVKVKKVMLKRKLQSSRLVQLRSLQNLRNNKKDTSIAGRTETRPITTSKSTIKRRLNWKSCQYSKINSRKTSTK